LSLLNEWLSLFLFHWISGDCHLLVFLLLQIGEMMGFDTSVFLVTLIIFLSTTQTEAN
ncbi:hypothetical protein ACJX0J_012836, partial [Zea mays]